MANIHIHNFIYTYFCSRKKSPPNIAQLCLKTLSEGCLISVLLSAFFLLLYADFLLFFLIDPFLSVTESSSSVGNKVVLITDNVDDKKVLTPRSHFLSNLYRKKNKFFIIRGSIKKYKDNVVVCHIVFTTNTLN